MGRVVSGVDGESGVRSRWGEWCLECMKRVYEESGVRSRW